MRSLLCVLASLIAGAAFAQTEPKGEMNLVLPDFTSVQFLGISGQALLSIHGFLLEG